MNPPDILRRAFRRAASFAPYIGLAPSPDRSRPEGISAFIRTGNAADWIEASVRSIAAFADEIVIAENDSSDGTKEIIERLARELGNVRAYSSPRTDYLKLTSAAAESCRYRWLVRWDADFVAHTSGQNDILNLRKRLLSLDGRRHHCVYLRPVNLFGDLEHVYGRGFLWADCAYTASRSANYIFSSGCERLSLPKYYALHQFTEPYFFHVNIKPLRAMLLRHFWNDLLWERPEFSGPVPEEYVLNRIKKDWNCATLTEGEREFLSRIVFPNVRRYNPVVTGPYPDLLKPLVARAKYKIIYRDNVPVSMQDGGKGGA